MYPEGLSAEDQAFVDRVVKATTGFGETLMDAAITYVDLNSPEQELEEGEPRLRAQELIESLAEQWRQAEVIGATHLIAIDELQSEDFLSLVGAIEDSLVLALTSDPRHRPLMLSLDETGERTKAIGGMSHREEGSLHPRTAKTDGTWEELVRHFEPLDDLLVRTLDQAFDFFLALGKRGELDHDALRELPEQLAVCLRSFDAERTLVAAIAAERLDVRPSLALLRTMLQGLVLRLSEDPSRRAQAIPIPELGTRVAPVFEAFKALDETPGVT